MRRLENFIGIFLTGLFTYSLLELMYSTASVLEESPTLFIPFRINSTVVLIGLLASILSAIFFPLWNFKRYLNTMNIREISLFKGEYKFDYIQLSLGFFGLTLWCASSHIFDFWWWAGTIFCLLSISLLCFAPMVRRHLHPRIT